MREHILSDQREQSISPVGSGVLQRDSAAPDRTQSHAATPGSEAVAGIAISAIGGELALQGPEFSQVPVHSDKRRASGFVDILREAGAQQASPLEASVQHGLEQHLGHDLSNVRVHQNPAAAHAAEALGARAYTLGNSIYLGSEVASLSQRERTQVLAHEAVHTVQQGGGVITPCPGLAVSSPNDAAEYEAEQIASTFDSSASAPASRSLALRDSLRGNPHQPAIARMTAPLLQRNLTGKKTVKDGNFDLNLKTESHPGAKCGMSGTIKFTASDKAPDSNNIRLLQIARLEDLGTGKEYVWTGGEANRNKVQTAASKGIDPGYFVDTFYSGKSPRSKKTDAAVSPYYIDAAGAGGNNKDGSKKGKTVKEASLWDYPGWSSNSRFSFETAAKGADTGYVFATLRWGFTISDAAKGKVTKEHATAHRSPSATFGSAVKSFNEFFKNPGSSKAP